MEKTTLVEAYRHRASIEQAGQAIYCKGYMTGILYRLVFHARQPGGVWYNLWMIRGDDISLVGMHMNAVVYIGEKSIDAGAVGYPCEGQPQELKQAN